VAARTRFRAVLAAVARATLEQFQLLNGFILRDACLRKLPRTRSSQATRWKPLMVRSASSRVSNHEATISSAAWLQRPEIGPCDNTCRCRCHR
jgi:hypothetical protein